MSQSLAEKKPRVLISGAGIAGTTLAFWLSKAGIPVTVLERYKEFRKEGQTVDVRQEALQILEWMGLQKAVMSLCTKEAGLKIVDSQNTAWASFPKSKDENGYTQKVEILRSSLAKLIFNSCQNNIEYKFGATIDSIEETEDAVRVTLDGDETVFEYDMIVLAEGLLSRNRAKVFKEDIRAPLVRFDVYAIIFSYEQGSTDNDWARVYHMPKRRVLAVRPDGFSKVRAIAAYCHPSEATRLIASAKTSPAQQKEHFIKLFKGSGWESDKIMEGLRKADDMHIYEVAQVKANTWSKGRVVLLGDSAYCPSAATNMGTTAAIVGSYMLASKIIKHKSDYQRAFSAYETTLRPWINDVQRISPGFPALFFPDSILGVYLLRTLMVLLVIITNSKTFAFVYNIVTESNIFGWLHDTPSSQPEPDKFELPPPSIFE
ncbi:hypothetical protein O181_057404 [Austropuccinia psidii MF-1]|uniref:FAD-binding domain-containing protein n=1 Tax=Austropuccinia psidii MF-1 TaxID=1389203 RepID=A0A9Q3HWN0_9BASI|nr:hypothetical protein [Austropuccinia psidii MF-1]